LWVPLALALLLSCWPRSAFAQAQLELQVSAREISVGDRLDVQLDAMSDDGDAPTDPELIVPNSFQVQGPSIGTRQQVSITGFRMVRQSGISANWQLTPTRAGVYSIGPASVQSGGQRRQAQAVQIRVLPEGQRPQRQQQRRGRRGPGFNPFDPFGNDDSFDDLFDRLRGGGTPGVDRLPSMPDDLLPQQLLDDVAFVEAHLDTLRAVVGQQVTLSIYAHGAQGLFQEAAGAREPSHPDFLAQRLVEDGSHQPVYQYTRDGQRWIAVKVREIALFPLRAGRLTIGPLEFGFLGRRYGGRGAEGLRRQTRPLVVEVTEPPALGRPAGYAGDVGSFELSAVVEPRHIPAGGSIAVTARVQGTGRLPGALKLPEQAGVEWLEPTLRDDVAMTGNTLGGSRVFNYVVRMTRAGVIDLGNLSLPLFNPKTGRYRVVLAPLGQVTVDAPPPSAAPPGASATPPVGPRLSELVKFRTQLRALPPSAYWGDHAVFYWSLGAGPLLVLVAAGLGQVQRRVRRRLARREQSQATHATRALGEARQALSRAELSNAVAAAERALYLALEWATGLRARAFLRSELAQRLSGAGLAEPLAKEAAELLGQCGELRLTGSSQSGAFDGVLKRVEVLVKRLLREPPRRAARGEAGEEVRA
jgi:hypothetical protein